MSIAALGYPISAEFWVDLNLGLRLGDQGGELFLERRFAEEHLATWGISFTSDSPATAEWAAGQGLTVRQWREGEILEIPKLDGPMIRWRTEFSGQFHRG